VVVVIVIAIVNFRIDDGSIRRGHNGGRHSSHLKTDGGIDKAGFFYKPRKKMFACRLSVNCANQ
jgi:hypothetical protein